MTQNADVGFVGVHYRNVRGEPAACSLAEAGNVAFDQCEPVRRFPAHRQQLSMPGLYWFAKTGRHVPYESRLEMSVLVELDFILDVTAIAAQPFRIEYRRNGKVLHHVPDFLVLLRSEVHRVIDVKPADKITKPANQLVFDATRMACREAGWDYVVATGLEPVAGANLLWLAGYRRRPADPFGYESLLLDRCDHPTPFVDLVASVGPPALVRPVLFHLLWRQELTFDRATPLSGGTLVALRGDRRDAA